jgi:acetylornithine deacetylase/succinyl-diaminopimelate desuccinylase-like protein
MLLVRWTSSSQFLLTMHPGIPDLLTFLRFPSVSTKPDHRADVRACAEWLQARLSAIGLSTEMHETPGHPVVLARNVHRPDRRTVMIYGHYDVQPAEPLAEWKSPAFEPDIREGRIWCRGATDNKGQLMAHLKGVEETLAKHSDLPVNLIFLFEGEEEIGSPNLRPFLEANREALACDVVAISDTGMISPGMGTMTYGLRGIACCEVIIKGAAVDLHSGIFGGIVANAATLLARIAGSLHDKSGRIQIPGFYDDVLPLQDWEREAWSRITDFDAIMMKAAGVTDFYGEEGYTTIERLYCRPTAEVNGLSSGWQGAGTKTVIPRHAMGKLSFRLVPGQSPPKLKEAIDAFLHQHQIPGTKIETVWENFGEPYLIDPFSKFGQAAQRALKRTFTQGPALIREGASIPIVTTFQQVLGVDSLLLGLGAQDCQAHAPNESFPLENFASGVLLNQVLLEELATA